MAVVYLNDLEYLGEDLGMFDFDEFEDGGFGFDMQDHLHEDLHAELLDYFDYPERQQNDTSATEYRNGKDMQGIPWERLNYTRGDFRTMRLNRYQNFESLSVARDNPKKEQKRVQSDNTFYDFQFNTRLAKTTIVHFQDASEQAGAVNGDTFWRWYDRMFYGLIMCLYVYLYVLLP